MKRIARFEKVSYEQFKKDFIDTFGDIGENDIKYFYDNVKLPKRGTAHSAGYDFFMPFRWILRTGQTVKIPTGIRCKMEDGWVLQCYPRSSMGFKYRLQLDNTVPIIDSDYYNAKNEGHIFLKISCDAYTDKEVLLDQGDAFVQGIFMQYGITEDDDSTAERIGGIGSTSEK